MPAVIRRGEVWWVDFDPARGSEIRKTRPVVVVGSDSVNRARRTIIVVPLSTGPAPYAPIVVGTPSAGPDSVAVCDQVRAADRSRFVRRSGTLAEPDLRAVEAGLRAVLAL